MEIVNGRWMHNGDRVNQDNFDEFLKIKNAVVSLYGDNITYERVKIISEVKKFDNKKEKLITKSLENSLSN